MVNLWAALHGAHRLHRPSCAVHRLTTLSLGPVRGTRTRPHIHRVCSLFASSTLAQDTPGRLRRWIILIYVGWLPPDFTASRSWPFSIKQGSSGGNARLGIIPPDTDLVETRVLHTGPTYPDPTCLLFLLFACFTEIHGRAPDQAATALSRGISRQTMSQINPTNSRAMATHTNLVFLPAWVSVR